MALKNVHELDVILYDDDSMYYGGTTGGSYQDDYI